MIPRRGRISFASHALIAVAFAASLISYVSASSPTECLAALARDLTRTINETCNADTAYSEVYQRANEHANQFADCTGNNITLQPLKILSPEQTKGGIEDVAQQFTQATGFTVLFDFVEVTELAEEIIKSLGLQGQSMYSGWIMDPTAVVDISLLGGLYPLDSYIAGDPDVSWPDITRFMRTASVTYNKTIIGVPLAGKTSTLFYRKDVFEARNISVPSTWHEMLEVASKHNGTDLNGDNQTDYSLCWQSGKCFETRVLLPQILTGMTQFQGTSSGWLLDPNTLQTFANTPAMAQALDMLAKLEEFVAPLVAPCGLMHPRYISGECLMTIKWDELFKAAEETELLWGRTGTAPLPGWSEVYNRTSGSMVQCTRDVCPHATLETSANGGSVFVNRAPFNGFGGFAGAVNAFATKEYRDATYKFFSFIANPKTSLDLVSTSKQVGPFRSSHLNTSTEALQRWRSYSGGVPGRVYNVDDTRNFLEVIMRQTESLNTALDLRVVNAPKYMDVLEESGRLAANRSMLIPDIMKLMASSFNAILLESDPDQVRRTYWAGLGLDPPPQPPPPPTPPEPPAPNPSSPSTGLAVWQIALLVICGVVGVALLGVALLYLSKRKRMLSWMGAPKASPDTTLVVTDILESTQLWETLQVDVMNSALDLHHATVRKLMSRFQGYEIATEGDSFIISFHQAEEALLFSIELQIALLNLAWSEEVLAHPVCKTEWVRLPRYMGLNLLRQEVNKGSIFAYDGSPWINEKTAKLLDIASWSKSTISQSRMLRAVSSVTGGRSRAPDDKSESGPPDTDRPSSRSIPGSSGSTQSVLYSGSMMPRLEEDSDVQAQQQPTFTVRQFFLNQWEPQAPIAGANTSGLRIAFKGMRVRIGMHSGVGKNDTVRHKAAGRLSYTGMPVAIAKCTCDAAQAGMVLLTSSTFERLHLRSAKKLKAQDIRLVCMGEHELKDPSIPPVLLYQAIAQPLVPRVGLFGPLRVVQQNQAGAMEAPLGDVTAVFANMVGVSTLMAWNQELASRSLDLYHARASQELERVGGYMVELTGGLCLASFTKPLDAVAFGVSLIEELKNEDWPDELLSHELCEEVALEDGGSEFFQRCATSSSNLQLNGGSAPVTLAASADSSSTLMRSSHLSRHKVILFRGPRYKVGIDIGTVSGDMSAVTGRLNYRGKVMNRAARIAERAFSGQCWCSAGVWECSLSDERFEQPDCNLQFRELGQHLLKGVQEPMQLVQCSLRSSAPVSAVRTPGTSTRYSACASHRAPASNLGSHRSSHSYEGQRPPPLSVPQSTMSPKPSMRILPSKMFTNPLAHIPSLKMQSTLTRSPQVKGTGASKRHVMFGPIDIESGSEPEARTPPHGMASREMSMTSTPVVPEESESM